MSLNSFAQHHIPFYGSNMEVGISPARAKMLAAVSTPEVEEHFQRQVCKMIDAGVVFEKASPAVAGGLLVTGANPQHVYDAVFAHSSDNDNKRSSNVVSFVSAKKEEREASVLREAFENAAPRYKLGKNFAMAARALVADNSTAFAPALQAA